MAGEQLTRLPQLELDLRRLMRRTRRILLAALTSACILTALGILTALVDEVMPAIPWFASAERVDDAIEIPLTVVGASGLFTVLATALSLVREAQLRRIAPVSLLLVTVVGGLLLLSGAPIR